MTRILSSDAPRVPGRLPALAAVGRDRQGRLMGRVAPGAEPARTRCATFLGACVSLENLNTMN
jgi:hypothetical protein